VQRVRPRPVVPSGSVSVGRGSGWRSPRASLTSIRRRPAAGPRASVSRKQRPGTRPCSTALAVSSATTSSARSMRACETPQERSSVTARSRARRAPRRVEDRSWVKAPTGAPMWGVAGVMVSAWREGAGGGEYRAPYAEGAYGAGASGLFERTHRAVGEARGRGAHRHGQGVRGAYEGAAVREVGAQRAG